MAIINVIGNQPLSISGTDEADLFIFNGNVFSLWLEGQGGNDFYQVGEVPSENNLKIAEQPGGGIDTVFIAGFHPNPLDDAFVSLDGLSPASSPNTLENLIIVSLSAGISSSGASMVVGNALNNQLTVQTSIITSPTIDGGAGADTMAGGNGNNTYIVDNVGDVVIEKVGEGLDRVEATANHVLSANVENLFFYSDASTANLNGTGNALNNWLFGNSGNNLLSSLGGDDLDGGEGGNDTLLGGDGSDTLDGGDGNDSLNGGTGNDLLSDLLFGGEGQGNDILVGDAGDDSLSGGVGNDKLDGGLGNDYMLGDEGVDTLLGAAGNDTLDGGEGDGVVDSLDGGAGNDRFYIGDDGAVDVVTDAAGGDDVVVSRAISYVLPVGIESLYLEGEAVIGTGNAGGNFIQGTDSDNQLLGMAGNDVLDGGLSDFGDILVGGLGNDRYIVNESNDFVVEAAGPDIDTVFANIGTYVLPTNVEHLSFYAATSHIGIGNAAANAITITGPGTDDELRGFDGNDTLDGGTGGADSLYGGKGNDAYIINDVDQEGAQAIELFNEGIDTVRSVFSYELGNNIENALLLGAGNEELIGNNLNNSLTGNSGNNFLWGRGGNDLMTGGLGNDEYLVEQGDGAGLLVAAASEDNVVEGLNAGTDRVLAMTTTYILPVNVEHLTFAPMAGAVVGSGNALDNRIEGNAFANTLNGLEGKDTLLGNAGNDTLNGGGGNDRLDGGRGADTMVGGLGDDLYLVNAVGDVVNETLGGGGVDKVESSVTFTLSAGVETLILTGSAEDGTGNDLANFIWGTVLGNVLTGLGGNDTLDGLGGLDSVVGGAGNDQLIGGFDGELDTMVGGDGDDIYFVDRVDEVVFEAGTAGSGIDRVITLFSGEGYTLGANVENLALSGGEFTIIEGIGNTSANTIQGNELGNFLSGLGGNDTLHGGLGSVSGNDTLNGGTGNDSMIGAGGDDDYIVDSGDGAGALLAEDIVVEALGGGYDRVLLAHAGAVNYVAPLNIEEVNAGDSLGGALINITGNTLDNVLGGNAANNTLLGGLGNDSLFGAAGNDSLLGDAGHDTLNGGTGNDTMAGGAGHDVYFVDAPGDVVNETIGGGIDAIAVFGAEGFPVFTLPTNVEHADIDTNGETLTFNGNALQNTLIVLSSGPLTINADNGDDTVLLFSVVDPASALVLNGQGGTGDLLGFQLGAGTYNSLDVTGFENIDVKLNAAIATWNLDVLTSASFSISGSSELTLTNLSLASGFRVEDWTGTLNLGFGNTTAGEDIARVRLVDDYDLVLLAANVETLELETEGGSGEIDVSGMAQTTTVHLGGPGSVAMVLGDGQVLSLNGYSGSELALGGDDSGGLVNNNTIHVDNSHTTILLDDFGNGFTSLTVDTTGAAAESDITVEGPLNTLVITGDMGELLRLEAQITAAEGTPTVQAGEFLGDLIFTNDGIGLTFNAGDTDSDWLRLNGSVNETLNYATFLNLEDIIEDSGSGDNDTLNADLTDFEGGLAISNIENLNFTFNAGTGIEFIDADFIESDSGSFNLNLISGEGVHDVTVENLHGDLTATGPITVHAFAVNMTGEGGYSLAGGTGSDELGVEGSSSDILDGGLGNDTLSGGESGDNFVFDTALGATNVDTILDFQQWTDLIVLDHTIFGATIADGEGGGSGLTAAEFLASAGNGGVATTAAQRIIYDTSTGALYYDADGNGGGSTSIQFAELGDAGAGTGIPTITEFDFFIVP